MSIANNLLDLYTNTDAALKHCNEKLAEKRVGTAATLYEVADKITTLKADYGKLIDGTVTKVEMNQYKNDGTWLENIRPYAFYECKDLETVRLHLWIKTIGDYAFYDCPSMNLTNDDTNIYAIGNYAFYGCSNLTRVPYGGITLETIGDYAFYGCTKLKSISLYYSSDLKMGSHAFEECTGIETLEGRNYAYAEDVEIGSYAFKNCTNLTTIVEAQVSKLGDYAFDGCTKLTKAEFNHRPRFGVGTFRNCSSLNTLIIRSIGNWNEVLETADSLFEGTPIAQGTGYIYLPSSVISSLQSASGWSQFASQIRAIEDYPEITE